jgi:selenide,water dikinase
LPADPLAGSRLLTSTSVNEDAAVVRLPGGKALVQTVDFFTPIVNNPFDFGRIAAANALSDIYAMGGEPWCAMNIVCFPLKELSADILAEILRGGAQTIREAGAVLAGGHSVEDTEIKYGLAVSGLVDPDSFASNAGLRPGDTLVLTKPLGTGILATAVKASWDDYEEMEAEIIRCAARLNAVPGAIIRDLRLAAATDVTGFGLGGHVLEMAQASNVDVEIELGSLPLLPQVYELAGMGLVPLGSHANREYRSCDTRLGPGADPVLVDIVFDAQTSGGMILALPEEKLEQALERLVAEGETAAVIGRVLEPSGGPRLLLK